MTGTHKMNADRPISKPDEDTLERCDFASAVADVIRQEESAECFVVSVNGPWGCGKTSLLNLICHFLEDRSNNSKPLIVRFNPWLFSDQTNLVKSFFSALSSAIGRDNTSEELKKAGRLISAFSALVKPVKYIPGINALADVASDLFDDASDAIGKMASALDKDLDGIKSKINAALSSQKQRIFVILDDIDRLDANEIRQIFRLVRSLADFSNITYLMAFDREATIKALDELQRGKGNEFLEKIVQITFNMPTPGEGIIEADAIRRISILLGDLPPRWLDNSYLHQYKYYGLYRLFRTPRDVIRFMNVLDFNWTRLKGEVNAADLMVLTALQVFCNDLYVALPYYKSLLIVDISTYAEATTSLPKDNGKGLRDQFDQLVSKAPPSYTSIIRDLLKLIFPRLVSIVLKESSRSYSDSELLWTGRVAHESNFDRYFRYGLANSEISQDSLSAIFSAMKTGNNLEHLFGETTIKRCAQDAISRIISAIRDEKIAVCVEECARVLVDIGDELQPYTYSEIGIDNFVRIILLSEKDESTRWQIMSRLIESCTKRNATLSHLVHDMVLEHEDRSHTMPHERLVSKEHLADVTCKMASLFESWYANEKFKLDKNIFQQFYTWRWCDKTVNIQSRFAKFVDTAEKFLRFLEIWSSLRYDLKSIWDFVTVDQMRPMVKEIKESKQDATGISYDSADLIEMWANFVELLPEKAQSELSE